MPSLGNLFLQWARHFRDKMARFMLLLILGPTVDPVRHLALHLAHTAQQFVVPLDYQIDEKI